MNDRIHDVNYVRACVKYLTVALFTVTLTSGLSSAQTLSVKDIDSAGLPPGLVRMGSNENPMGPSPKAIGAVHKYVYNVNRYGWYELDEKGMPSSLDTEERLTVALAKVDGVPLPENFDSREHDSPYFFAPGSGNILKLLAIAYLSQGGKEVVEAQVGYVDIAEEAEDLNTAGIPTKVTLVPMTSDYKHDLDGMRDAITPQTSLVAITNPNNPTGTLLTFDELRRFVESVPPEVIVLIDEAYVHFVDDANYQSAIPLALEHDNVIVVRTFSKVYGIKGLGLGYAVAGSKILDRMSMYSTGSPSMLARMAGAAAVEDTAHFEKSRQAVKDSKAMMYNGFDEMGLEYIRSQSSFVMVNVKHDSETVSDEMWRRRVRISDRGSDHMKGWIRVSAGTKEETQVFLKTLRTVLTKLL